MSRQPLSLTTLENFDVGKAYVAWQQALKRAVLDCLDRIGEKKARTVVLVTSIVPVLQQDGDVVDANVDFKITISLPPWQTATRPVGVSRDGSLFFQELIEEDDRQTTLDDLHEQEADVHDPDDE